MRLHYFFIFLFICKLSYGQVDILDSLHQRGLVPLLKPKHILHGYVPTVDLEDQLIIMNEKYIDNEILVIRPTSNAKLRINGSKVQLLKDQLYHFGLYEDQDTISFESLKDFPFDSIFSYQVPDFHLLFYNVRNNRSYSLFESRNLSYEHEMYFKNFKPEQLLMSRDEKHQILITSQENEILIDLQNRNHLKPKLEGWEYHIQHDVELYSMKFWDHTNPVLYNKQIKIWSTSNPDVTEVFINKIGLRDTKWINNRLNINKHDYKPKAYLVHEETDDISSLLISLKKHHFNTIILQNQHELKTFQLCDSLGIYVIQKVDGSIFYDWHRWFDYFIKIKDHTSFIAWYNNGMDPFILKLANSIDKQRIMFNRENFRFVIFQKWFKMSDLDKKNIGIQNQPFKFYYSQEQNIFIISNEELFKYSDLLDLKLVLSDSLGQIIFDETIPFTKSEVFEINLSELNFPTPKKFMTFKVSLIIREATSYYDVNEIVAQTIFEYAVVNDHLSAREKLTGVNDDFILTEIF